MVTVNEQIDFDTAQIIVEELGLEIVLKRKVVETVAPVLRTKAATSATAPVRPPVVAVMSAAMY